MARSPLGAPKPQRRHVDHVEVAMKLLATCWTDPVAGSSGAAEASVAAAAVDMALGLVERRMTVERGSLPDCMPEHRIHSVRVRSDAERLGHRVGP